MKVKQILCPRRLPIAGTLAVTVLMVTCEQNKM